MDNTKRPQHHNPNTLNIRAGKRLRDPLDYHHPYDSMRRYAELLALRHDWPTVLLAAKTYGKGVLNPLFSASSRKFCLSRQI